MAEPQSPRLPHGTSLAEDCPIILQECHVFDTTANSWTPLSNVDPSSEQPPHLAIHQDKLILVTWNVDAISPEPEARTSRIINHILNGQPAPHIIFLQEVTRRALQVIEQHPRIRTDWYLSHANANGDTWGGRFCGNVTLLSRSLFRRTHEEGDTARVADDCMATIQYPSKFGKAALGCDVFIPNFGGPPGHLVLLQLINVQLDPQRNIDYRRWQLAIASSFLRHEGRGLVAGDFNAMQPEDSEIIDDCGLVDGWTATHPGKEGFTWHTVGDSRYPPTRLDKVATLGLQVVDVRLLHPGTVPSLGAGPVEQQSLPWSTHSGLLCIFGNAT